MAAIGEGVCVKGQLVDAGGKYAPLPPSLDGARCLGALAEFKPMPSERPAMKVIVAVGAVSPLAQADRQRIKTALDKHFDDGAGQYLDGKSDQIIADSLGVPRIHVERIREAAYGPIRVTPQMLSLKAEIEAHGNRITEAIKKAEFAIEAAGDLLNLLRERARDNDALASQVEALMAGRS